MAGGFFTAEPPRKPSTEFWSLPSLLYAFDMQTAFTRIVFKKLKCPPALFSHITTPQSHPYRKNSPAFHHNSLHGFVPTLASLDANNEHWFLQAPAISDLVFLKVWKSKCICMLSASRRFKRHRFTPWVRKIPWRKA